MFQRLIISNLKPTFLTSLISMYDQFYSFILFRETILNNNKRVIQAVYTDKHLCTHEYVPVSCCPRPSQKPPTLVFFTEYHFFKPIMPFTKLFSRSFFNERMLFFSTTTTDSFTSMIEPPFPRREAIIT